MRVVMHRSPVVMIDTGNPSGNKNKVQVCLVFGSTRKPLQYQRPALYLSLFAHWLSLLVHAVDTFLHYEGQPSTKQKDRLGEKDGQREIERASESEIEREREKQRERTHIGR